MRGGWYKNCRKSIWRRNDQIISILEGSKEQGNRQCNERKLRVCNLKIRDGRCGVVEPSVKLQTGYVDRSGPTHEGDGGIDVIGI